MQLYPGIIFRSKLNTSREWTVVAMKDILKGKYRNVTIVELDGSGRHQIGDWALLDNYTFDDV